MFRRARRSLAGEFAGPGLPGESIDGAGRRVRAAYLLRLPTLSGGAPGARNSSQRPEGRGAEDLVHEGPSGRLSELGDALSCPRRRGSVARGSLDVYGTGQVPLAAGADPGE